MNSELAEPVFLVLNAAVLPWWGVFLAAPRSNAARALASHTAIFLAFGAIYLVLLVAAYRVAWPLTSTPLELSFWTGLLGSPVGFLAGWSHYLAFDLFVGAWIVRESQRLALTPRVSLAFTLMAGPLGLGMFGVRRSYHLRTLGQLGDGDIA